MMLNEIETLHILVTGVTGYIGSHTSLNRRPGDIAECYADVSLAVSLAKQILAR